MDSKSTFILAAIHDAQSTIRSTDVKVATLLAGLIIPIASIDTMWGYWANISALTTTCIPDLIGIAFLVTWLLAFMSLVLTISAISNPASHIVNSNSQKGSFYGGKLFEFGWADMLLNRSTIRANKDIVAFYQDYPSTEDETILELAFEHLKLIYIRDIKLHRLRLSIKVLFVWPLLGFGIYFYSKLG
mgnify:FL=1